MEWVRCGRIRYFDGDHENLVSANLVHTKDNCPDNLNRRIFFAGNVMFLYVKSCKTCYFCDYDPELYKLLCECQIIWAYNKCNRQIHAKIDGILFGFHTLIYAFHHYGARQNNFISAIQKLQADLNKRKLTIDHLDDSLENNLIWNLSLMTDSQNGRKSDIFGKVRWPFFAFAVYHNKKYKVLFGRVRQGDVWFAPEFDADFVICNT